MSGLFDLMGGSYGEDDPRRAAAIALFAGLLGGKGNPGGIVSDSITGAQKSFLLNREAQQRLEENQAKIEKLRADAERTKTQPWKDAAIPSAIQIYEYTKSLSPEDRVLFERGQRAANLFDMNGVKNFMHPSMGPVPLTDLNKQAGAEATIAGEKQRAQEVEKARYDLVPSFNPETKKIELRPRIDMLPHGNPAPQSGSMMEKVIAAAKRNGDQSFNYDFGGANKGSMTVPQGAAYQAPEERKISAEEEEKQIKTTAKNNAAVDRSSLILKNIDDSLSKVGTYTTGLPGAIFSKIPGTEAFDLRKTVDSIKANIGFAELQAMRDASPTGGALGQVALQELAMLQAVLGNLDTNQSEPEIRKQLTSIKKHYGSWKKIMEEAGYKGTNTGSVTGDLDKPPANDGWSIKPKGQ